MSSASYGTVLIRDRGLYSWRDDFSMSIKLDGPPFYRSIIQVTEVKCRARREVFESSGSRILNPVKRISLAEALLSYSIRALEDLVRRPELFNETKSVKLSGEMVAHIGVTRERYANESSKIALVRTEPT